MSKYILNCKISFCSAEFVIFGICGILFGLGVTSDIPTNSEYIEETGLNFGILPGAKESSIKDHDQVVACKVNIKAKERKGKGRYGLNEIRSLVNSNLCTHLIYGPLNINKEYEIENNSSFDDLRQLTSNVQKLSPHIKILLEITILKNTTRFLKPLTEFGVVADQSRIKFAKYMINFLKAFGLNGLSLDVAFYNAIQGPLTFPKYLSNAQIPSAEVLARVLKDEFQKEGLLIATEIDLYRKRIIHKAIIGLRNQILSLRYGRVAEISKIFNFVFVVGFNTDYRGQSTHNAPVYSDLVDDDTIYEHLRTMIVEWRTTPNTLVFSVEFFGHTYLLYDGNSSLPGLHAAADPRGFPFRGPYLNNTERWGYNEICSAALLGNESWNFFWDNKAKVPFIRSEQRWITFENHRSLYEKVSLALSFGMKGIMVQNVDTDDFTGNCTKSVTYPLLKTVHYAMGREESKQGSLRCSLLKNKTKGQNYRPIVVTNFFITKVSMNSSVLVECKAEGFPEPDIELVQHVNDKVRFRRVKIVKQSLEKKDCSVENTKVFSFQVTSADSGKYSCLANNSAGRDQRDFFVMLKERPFLLAENNVWIEETELDFKMPDVTNINLPDLNDAIVCRVDISNKRRKGESVINIADVNTTFLGKLCSHLLYGSINVNQAYEIEDHDNMEGLSNVQNISRKYPDIKILLEITIKPYEDIIDSRIVPENLQKLKDIMRSYGFHGIHFSSTFYLNAVTQRNEKEISYVAMANQMKREFQEDKFLISTEIEIYSKEMLKNYTDLYSKIIQRFDIVVLKAYGFNNNDTYVTTQYNAPYDSFELNGENIVNNLLLLLKENKAGTSSLVLGVPLYGHHYFLKDAESFTFGYNSTTAFSKKEKYSYSKICSWVISKRDKWKMYWDNKAKVPFLKSLINWITFDNPRSIYEKVVLYESLQSKFKLKGMMVDSIDMDDNAGVCANVTFPLLRIVYDVLRGTHNKTESLKAAAEAASMTYLTWGLIIAVVAIVVIVILLVNYILYKRMEKDGLSKYEIQGFINGKQGITDNDYAENPDQMPYDGEFEIPIANYTIDKSNVLGSGAFGVVYNGIANGTKVAVKSTKPGAEKQYLKSLLSELKVMMYLGTHPNIVNLIGAGTSELRTGVVYIFVELCAFGNLQEYIRKARSKFVANISKDANYYLFEKKDSLKKKKERVPGDFFSSDNLINWSFQISLALEHLNEKKLIHGDLACRNVLVFEKDLVKLTDFGLSRKLYNYSLYVKTNQEPLPWRWMAIESLRDLTFSIQSDTWSYGIILWELFSLCETPYPGLSWTADFVDMLDKNFRMQKPNYATQSIYEFMLECWRANPNERPTPDQATRFFLKLIQNSAFADYAYASLEDTGNRNLKISSKSEGNDYS